MLVYQAKCYSKETKELINWYTSPSLKDVTEYASKFKNSKVVYVKIVDSTSLNLDGFKS